jgi:hypothetical protein
MWLFAFVSLILSLAGSGSSQETTPAGIYVDNACICVTAGYCNLAGGIGNEI